MPCLPVALDLHDDFDAVRPYLAALVAQILSATAVLPALKRA